MVMGLADLLHVQLYLDGLREVIETTRVVTDRVKYCFWERTGNLTRSATSEP